MALLLLRISVAVGLLAHVGSQNAVLVPLWLLLALSLLAVFLCLGLLTPVVASLCAVFVLVNLLLGDAGVFPLAALPLLNAIALALLGPGAYSVDARVFGRRLVVLPPGQHGDL